MTSVSLTARARARAAITDEITSAARRQVAAVGAPALSLRAVARELGMVSSAVYRYFPSRDALLTALIVDAFDAVGGRAEEALDGASRTVLPRWRAVSTAIRGWALANPHDYALVYGSPVPGYQAPDDTVTPAARVSLVMLRLVADGVSSGEIETAPSTPMPRRVRGDLGHLRDIAGLSIPDEVLARALLVWTGMFGTISFELFGHLHRVIEGYDEFFEHQMRRAGTYLIGRPAGS
jgi:AcrR family transcriptional regulator